MYERADHRTGREYKVSGTIKLKTMEKLKTLNVDLYRTDKQKTIIATSDGTQITWNKPPCQDYSAGVKPDGSTE